MSATSADDDVFITAYQLRRRREFGAHTAFFSGSFLEQVTKEGEERAALVTIGPTSSGSEDLLRQLRGLAPQVTASLRTPPREWVVLRLEPRTRRIVEQRHKSITAARQELKRTVAHSGLMYAVLMSSAVLPVLNESIVREAIKKVGELIDARRAEVVEAANREGLLKARDALIELVPCYTAEEIATLRGSTTTNASQLGADLRNARKIFGVRHGRAWLYPKLQFNRNGEPAPEIQKLLKALGAEATGWDVLQWFAEPNAELGGKTPTEAWTEDRMAVVRAAALAHWFELG